MKDARRIYITEFDLKRLQELIWDAEQSDDRSSPYIKSLKAELDRAVTVAPTEVPADVITMNSKALIVDMDSGEEMIFTLVFPRDADISQDKISVLAPIGTALLGYRVGDVIEWEVPDGMRKLKVEQIVYQPEASGDYHL